MATLAAPPVLDSRLSPAASAFVSGTHQMLIDGKFTAASSGKTFPVYNPATGDEICQVPEADHVDVDKAVHAARRAFDSGTWPTMSPSKRGQLLWKLADLLEQHTAEFAELEAFDNGKPVSVARVADVPLAVDLFRYMAGWATKTMGSTIPLSAGHDFLAYTVREPVGVVAQIIPWNFPLLMAAWKLGPALATGCTVVMKLAEQTPLTGLRLAQLFVEAGFPPGVVNILTGFGEACGAPLAAHSLVDKVAFTGSTEVGKLIARAATGNLKKGHPRARRQVPRHHLPRRRHGRRHRRRRVRHLLQPGPGLLRRLPPLRARKRLRPGHRGHGRHRQQNEDGPRPRPFHGNGVPWYLRSSSTRSTATSPAAARRARKSPSAVGSTRRKATSSSPPSCMKSAPA